MKVGSSVVDIATCKCIMAICLNAIKQCYVFDFVNSLPTLAAQTRTSYTQPHTCFSKQTQKIEIILCLGKKNEIENLWWTQKQQQHFMVLNEMEMVGAEFMQQGTHV